jgi:hypothetical protein
VHDLSVVRVRMGFNSECDRGWRGGTRILKTGVGRGWV